MPLRLAPCPSSPPFTSPPPPATGAHRLVHHQDDVAAAAVSSQLGGLHNRLRHRGCMGACKQGCLTHRSRVKVRCLKVCVAMPRWVWYSGAPHVESPHSLRLGPRGRPLRLHMPFGHDCLPTASVTAYRHLKRTPLTATVPAAGSCRVHQTAHAHSFHRTQLRCADTLPSCTAPAAGTIPSPPLPLVWRTCGAGFCTSSTGPALRVSDTASPTAAGVRLPTATARSSLCFSAAAAAALASLALAAPSAAAAAGFCRLTGGSAAAAAAASPLAAAEAAAAALPLFAAACCLAGCCCCCSSCCLAAGLAAASAGSSASPSSPSAWDSFRFFLRSSRGARLLASSTFQGANKGPARRLQMPSGYWARRGSDSCLGFATAAAIAATR